MAESSDSNTDVLLDRAEQGDSIATRELFQRHRDQLRRMIAIRLDNRVQARIDPSDVVQETLALASGRLEQYLADRPIPFYAWLRQMAWEKLAQLHRHHLQAKKRNASLEQDFIGSTTRGSAMQLVEHLIGSGPSPSAQALKAEVKQRVHRALDELRPADREILILRYLEYHSLVEIGLILNLSASTVKVRHLRAIRRIHTVLKQEESDP